MSDAPFQTTVAQTLAVPRDGGNARWWFGSLAIIRATAEQTGGAFSLIDVTEPPGAEAPRHVHHREDEAFWMLEGTARFEVGDHQITASAGDFLIAPRDVPHRFVVGEAGCRMLFILTPGGFDQLVMATSEPATSRTVPPPLTEEPDWNQLVGIVASYGCEFLP